MSLWSAGFFVLLVLAGASDVARLRIPNAITAAVAVLAAVRASWSAAAGGEFDGSALLDHATAGGVMLAAGFVAFALRLFGGGDAKLIAAVALWFGWAPLPVFLAATAIGGGMLGLMLMPLRSLASGAALPTCLQRGQPVPYGVTVALAAALVEVRIIG